MPQKEIPVELQPRQVHVPGKVVTVVVETIYVILVCFAMHFVTSVRGWVGHIASVCKSYMYPSRNNYSRSGDKYTHVITEESTPVVSSTADAECYTLYHMPADDTIFYYYVILTR